VNIALKFVLLSVDVVVVSVSVQLLLFPLSIPGINSSNSECSCFLL